MPPASDSFTCYGVLVALQSGTADPVNCYTQKAIVVSCPDVSCSGNKVYLSECGLQIRFHRHIFSLEVASKRLSLWQLDIAVRGYFLYNALK